MTRGSVLPGRSQINKTLPSLHVMRTQLSELDGRLSVV